MANETIPRHDQPLGPPERGNFEPDRQRPQRDDAKIITQTDGIRDDGLPSPTSIPRGFGQSGRVIDVNESMPGEDRYHAGYRPDRSERKPKE
ncbi:MAG: hypothetical protein ACLQU2_01230 [Candidatus Binataceae bacterium]